MSQAALRVSNISMHIAGLKAVDDVSFEVAEGQIVSLIGPNGAGKTTTFNVISGYMRPTAGSVSLFGKNITNAAPEEVAAEGLIRSFQRTSVFPACSVKENLLTALHLQGTGGLLQALLRPPSFCRQERALNAKAEELMVFLGLQHRANELAGNLAYGEQRMLGVGLALAARPRILLLDEPAAGLNPSETEDFKQMIGRIRLNGVSILLVEHDMHMVMSISDHIVVLNHGQLIATGSPSEIQNNPEVIRAYLGSGIKNAQA